MQEAVSWSRWGSGRPWSRIAPGRPAAAGRAGPGAVGGGPGPGVGGGRCVDVGEHEGRLPVGLGPVRVAGPTTPGTPRCRPATWWSPRTSPTRPPQLRADGRPQFGAATLSRWVSSINQIHTAAGFARAGTLGGGPPRPVRGPPDAPDRAETAQPAAARRPPGDPGASCRRRSGCGRMRWPRTATPPCC